MYAIRSTLQHRIENRFGARRSQLFKSLVDQVLADEEACRILDFGVRDDALRDNNNDWGHAEYVRIPPTLASMSFILILYSSMSARWDDMALMLVAIH